MLLVSEFTAAEHMPSFWLSTNDTVAPFATGEEELRAYLGNRYTAKSDSHLVEEWVSRPRDSCAEIEDFYRMTDAYLYDLTKWHATNRFPYAEAVRHFAERHGLKHVLEFGCGIGSDGLKLLDWGFNVTFYDFRNPSTEYLQWRLKKRGITGDIIRYAGEDELPQNDLTMAIDVIEHVVDAPATLTALAARTNAFVVHFPLTTQKSKYPMHFDLNKGELRRLIKEGGFNRLSDLSSLRYKKGFLLWLTEAPEFWLRTSSQRGGPRGTPDTGSASASDGWWKSPSGG